MYSLCKYGYICLVYRAMAKHAGPRLPAIVECLCPSLNNIYECQRITVTAFFSEVIYHEILHHVLFFLCVCVQRGPRDRLISFH